MNDSTILAFPVGGIPPGHAAYNCAQSSVLTLFSNPCRGINYWLDYAWITTAILFPRNKFKLVPVPFFFPTNLSNVGEPNSEFGFVFSNSEAMMTPVYYTRTKARDLWHAKASYIGPFLYQPFAMLYRTDIFPMQITIKWTNLKVLAIISCLAAIASFQSKLAGLGVGIWAAINLAMGGLFAALFLHISHGDIHC